MRVKSMRLEKKQPWINVLRNAILSSLIWTAGISFIFWIFSAPEISFSSIFTTMLTYGVLLFGSASLLVEWLTPVFVPDEHKRKP